MTDAQHPAEPTKAPDEWASMTLCHAFLDTVARAAERTAFHWEASEGWQASTFQEYSEWVARSVTGLQELGIGSGDRVLLLLKNSKEHHVIDLACLFLGAVPIPVYYTIGQENLSHIVDHAAARLAVIEDDEGRQRLESASSGLSTSMHYLTLDNDASSSAGTTPFTDLLGQAPTDLEPLAAEVGRTDLAAILYTSGTTGVPKAVGISHQDALHAAARFETRAGLSFEGWRAVAYGPMAHSGERSFTHWPQMMYGFELADCADLTEMVRYRLKIMPHLWFGAPRLWEKERELLEKSMADDPDRQTGFEAARQTRLAIREAQRAGGAVPDDLREDWEQQETKVIRPTLAETGLQAVQVVISGSSPMSADLQQWWISLGLNLADAYGTSETLIVSWDPHQIVPGTAGRPLPGMQVKISDEGEILVKGPFEFRGYIGDDGSHEPVDTDGWYHTHDVGQEDESGFLRIIDRMDSMLAPTSGHNVSPVGLEAHLVEHPFISAACAVGSGRPYCGVLITLAPDAIRAELDLEDIDALSSDARVEAAVRAQIDSANEPYPRAEQLGAFAMLEDQWELGSSFLTPTNKLKRREIREAYESDIDQMYEGPDIRLSK